MSRQEEQIGRVSQNDLDSGLTVVTPENAGQVFSRPGLPARIWWEQAQMELCLVPAGTFLMGSKGGEGHRSEHPQHRVYLDGYYVGRYPVTNAQYALFVQESGHRVPYQEGEWVRSYCWNLKKQRPPIGKETHPVVLVDWNDAMAYCQWAALRLPTEAEWEKAARGTDGRRHPWGDQWDKTKCNLWTGKGWETTPVDAYPQGASPYGVLDMVGNVEEWCADWYDGSYYAHSPDRNPQGPESGTCRVLRGGSWLDLLILARCAFRHWNLPAGRLDLVGFRCVLPLESPARKR
ncbi:MAG: formylglycine-generating enzyme family protein [Anaerolineae bacterium]|nr:formylglycine-generating enzyme family protein [Anaerolineae bacterium]